MRALVMMIMLVAVLQLCAAKTGTAPYDGQRRVTPATIEAGLQAIERRQQPSALRLSRRTSERIRIAMRRTVLKTQQSIR